MYYRTAPHKNTKIIDIIVYLHCFSSKTLGTLLLDRDGGCGERMVRELTLRVRPVQQIHTEVVPVLIKDWARWAASPAHTDKHFIRGGLAFKPQHNPTLKTHLIQTLAISLPFKSGDSAIRWDRIIRWVYLADGSTTSNTFLRWDAHDPFSEASVVSVVVFLLFYKPTDVHEMYLYKKRRYSRLDVVMVHLCVGWLIVEGLRRGETDQRQPVD